LDDFCWPATMLIPIGIAKPAALGCAKWQAEATRKYCLSYVVRVELSQLWFVRGNSSKMGCRHDTLWIVQQQMLWTRFGIVPQQMLWDE
jgi:hypothetical protein